MLEAIFSMSTLWWICSIIWFLACVLLVGVVLMQKGKGAGFAGAFGVGGGSDAVFGPRGRKTAIVQLTYYAAAVFMVLSLTLSIVVGRISRGAAPEMVDENSAAQAALDDLYKDTPAAGATSATTTPPVTEGANSPAATPEAAPATDAMPNSPEASAPAEATAPAPAETPAPAEAPASSEPAPAGQ
ncbi:MAG: preprotein translocase subunit SecG [Candidatus Hydrogenedentes bacterium]|nr:preprotein translocase subunit SecG [Candidatus Hydrogenedentota bacterium]